MLKLSRVWALWVLLMFGLAGAAGASTVIFSYRGSGGNAQSYAAVWGSQGGNNGGLGNFGGKDTNMAVLFTGTEIDFYCQDSAAPGDTNMGFTLDGTYHAIDPSANTAGWLTLISGLSDTQHKLLIYSFTGGLGFGYDNLFRVTGANPAVAVPNMVNFLGSNGISTSPNPSSTVNNIVFDGDSRTFGQASSGLVGNTTTGGSYPALMIASLGSKYTGHNQGQSGTTIGGILGNAVYDIDTQYSSTYKSNVAIQGCGYNDPNSGVTLAQMEAACLSYVQGRQAAGFKVMCLTVYASFNSGTYGAYNAWLMAGGSGAEYVSDIASLRGLPYYSDNIHLTSYAAPAAQIKADYLAMLLGARQTDLPRKLNQASLSATSGVKGQENEIF